MAIHPLDDPDRIVHCSSRFPLLFKGGDHDIYVPLPLPGIVIFVHGVNSDGEWYEASEQGLCEGLNARLGRRDEDLCHSGPEAGQLHPVKYGRELTDDGYISPEVNAGNIINDEGTFSPVIRFRWGYKADSAELQRFGDSIYLNEQDYWGGGPFANGCTTLPDLWNEGLTESLFLWMQVQHMNPTDRPVYSCPPRPYFVLAAYRLAKLIESIRKLQADTPITIVCHSQGNMVAMAAAFLGDAMSPATDTAGQSAPCVADTYVLCNPPYSLVEENSTENWTESHMKDRDGNTGRQTAEARIKTLKAFFDIIRQRVVLRDTQTIERIDQRMTNADHCFSAQGDRDKHGLKGSNASNYGRVTLYCNPHDQVISALTVQGIGWRGLGGQRKDKTGLGSDDKDGELGASGAQGVFVQRVFAQDFAVGQSGSYHYWGDHWRKPEPGNQDYWFPNSMRAVYSVSKGLEANRSWIAKIFTVALSPFLVVATYMFNIRINAMPDKDWRITLEAPDLPEPFKPEACRFGQTSTQFDEGHLADGQFRNKDGTRDADDPFNGDREIPMGGSEGEKNRKKTDAAQGSAADEAGMRYEYHAKLRMQAKRDGRYKNEAPVKEENDPSAASADYKQWQKKQIKAALDASAENYATDHSSILTNPMHSRKALAYDVAIGVCDIRADQLHALRLAADWRFSLFSKLIQTQKNFIFAEYFFYGEIDDSTASVWANKTGSEGAMPEKIADRRQTKRPSGISD